VTVLAAVLGAALVASLVALAATAKLLADARRETAQLQETVESQLVETRNPRAVQAAGRVVTKVVEAAARVRDHGVGRMVLASLEDFTRWATEQRVAIGRMAADDGTVTILFSDIEGSTALNAGLGDARWVKVLAAHDELVETYVEKYRGLIVKTQGDGHMVVFSTPELALRAAVDIQRAFGPGGTTAGSCGVRRSGCGSACTRAPPSSATVTTWARTSRSPHGSPRRLRAARST
jgi:hypothetical protein